MMHFLLISVLEIVSHLYSSQYNMNEHQSSCLVGQSEEESNRFSSNNANNKHRRLVMTDEQRAANMSNEHLIVEDEEDDDVDEDDYEENYGDDEEDEEEEYDLNSIEDDLNKKKTTATMTTMSKNQNLDNKCEEEGAGERLSLREILQLFNCPISQEQAWAILYALLTELKWMYDHEFEHLNQHKEKLDMDSVLIEQQGSILLSFSKPKTSNDPPLNMDKLNLNEKSASNFISSSSTSASSSIVLNNGNSNNNNNMKISSKQNKVKSSRHPANNSSEPIEIVMRKEPIDLDLDHEEDHECNHIQSAASSPNASTPASPSPSPSPLSNTNSCTQIIDSTANNLVNNKTSSNQFNTLLNDTLVKQEVQNAMLKSVAYLIFDALDYGNNYSNEPELNNAIGRLLLLISGHYREFKENKLIDGSDNENEHENDEDEEGDDDGFGMEEYLNEDESIGFDRAIEVGTSLTRKYCYYQSKIIKNFFF